MQNTMLDSTVSSNSQQLLDLNNVHNGEHCIASLDPKDERENRIWFTIAMCCTIYGVAEQTIRNNLKSLWDDGEIGLPQILGRRINIEDSGGVLHPTTIYNLEVLNRLGMCCFRKNRKAKEIRDKFNDVLVERETGGYGIRTVDDMINDPDTAIRLLTQLKILRLQNDQLAMERDEAIRTKAMIGSSREATAMNTASQKSKECAKLTAENAELKDAVGRGTNWRTVNMMRAEWTRDFGHAPSWHKLKEFSADLPKEMQPIKDVEVKAVLRNGSEKVSLVNRDHREAWAKYREYEENLRVSARSRRDDSNEGIGLNDTDTEIEVF